MLYEDGYLHVHVKNTRHDWSPLKKVNNTDCTKNSCTDHKTTNHLEYMGSNFEIQHPKKSNNTNLPIETFIKDIRLPKS